jgi:NitT/TauT family transport system permease protein
VTEHSVAQESAKESVPQRSVRRRSGGHRLAAVLNAAWLRPFLFLIAMIVLWDVVIRVFNIPPYQIPKPEDVLRTLWTDWPQLLQQSIPTTVATIQGFLLSAVFGVVAAVMIASSRTIESYVYPLLVFSQSIPKIAIAPLLVVWFGFGMMPKVLCAFLLGFFPVVVSAVQGFKSVEPDMLDLARAMEARRLQIFRMVAFPHAMPAIFAGLKVSITLAVVGAVVGEFVGSNNGLGFVLQRSIGNFELPTMFAALVVLSLIGVVLFWVLDVVERWMIPWHASQRQNMVIAA